LNKVCLNGAASRCRGSVGASCARPVRYSLEISNLEENGRAQLAPTECGIDRNHHLNCHIQPFGPPGRHRGRPLPVIEEVIPFKWREEGLRGGSRAAYMPPLPVNGRLSHLIFHLLPDRFRGVRGGACRWQASTALTKSADEMPPPTISACSFWTYHVPSATFWRAEVVPPRGRKPGRWHRLDIPCSPCRSRRALRISYSETHDPSVGADVPIGPLEYVPSKWYSHQICIFCVGRAALGPPCLIV